LHPFFQAIEELVAADARRRASLDQEVMRIKRGLVDYARAEVARRKQHAAVQSFGDLLTALHRALRSAGGAQLTASIRARYRAALIDEFQDTDPVQYAIFRTLFGDAGLTLFQIGDPKQAIYAFRGADIFTYMNAARRAGERVYTLDRSYRSDPALLRAVNHVFAARAPFLYEDIRYVDLAPRDGAEERLAPPDGAPDRAALQLLFVRRTDERLPSRGKHIRADWAAAPLAERVAGEIVALLESSATIDGAPIAPRHVAVLCRTNKQAEATQQALMALQVPTVREGDNSVFDTATAEELERVLSAVLQPADARKAHSALATVLLGVSGQTLYRMRQGQDTEGELEAWMERLTAWARLWHERGFVHAFHRLVDDAEIQERLLTRPDGQRRLTDLLHLGELLHTAATAQHLGPLSLLVWLAHMRNDREARGALVGESAQVRLEHDDHAVMLTTIHRSKGLEYPIVFCPYLFSEPIQDRGAVRFHDDSDDHTIKLDIGSDDVDAHKLEARREAVAESLRLLYVALTRAKHRCYVVWGRFHRCGRSPLGYLLHQGDIADADLEGDIEPRLSKLDDEAILAEVRGLCDGSDGAMAVRDLDGEDARPYSRPTAARDDLAPRAARRELPALLRSASFSRIVAERAAHVSAPAEDGLDHDEAQPEESRLFGTADRAPVVLHDFPAGSRPGSCIHSVFEHIDFTDVDAGSLREPCSYWLEQRLV
ncbi:MAG: UvrD-helicase domain-containing protein, partial [Myxococcales bacterium]|nr:UvrD-helicase domain-containing protein [Myxococcales bacterium]